MKYVLTVSKNLIVSDKIGSIARSHGFDVVARTGEEAMARAKLSRPTVVVVDMEDNMDFLSELKKSNISSLVVGFYPHVKNEIKKEAEQMGYTNVFANSLMEQKLTELFGRLGNI